VKRRHCLHCGERLRWYRAYCRWQTRAAADAFVATLHPDLRADAVIRDETRMSELNPGHPEYQAGAFRVKYIDAEGDYGDNRFCTLRCGYRWAVTHTKEARPQ